VHRNLRQKIRHSKIQTWEVEAFPILASIDIVLMPIWIRIRISCLMPIQIGIRIDIKDDADPHAEPILPLSHMLENQIFITYVHTSASPL
jgi:hypothetical protein